MLPSVWLTAILFAAIDMLTVAAGWWSFNEKNIAGVYIGNLPLEELLFLVIIPQSTMFLWVVIRRDNARRNIVDALSHHYRKRQKR